MATRVICDHCGNTISGVPPKRYQVQRLEEPVYHSYQGAQANVLHGIAGIAYPTVQSTTTPIVHQVELCNTCDTIWLKRVKKLTEATEEARGDN